eukprot:Rmarinus@m.27668
MESDWKSRLNSFLYKTEKALPLTPSPTKLSMPYRSRTNIDEDDDWLVEKSRNEEGRVTQPYRSPYVGDAPVSRKRLDDTDANHRSSTRLLEMAMQEIEELSRRLSHAETRLDLHDDKLIPRPRGQERADIISEENIQLIVDRVSEETLATLQLQVENRIRTMMLNAIHGTDQDVNSLSTPIGVQLHDLQNQFSSLREKVDEHAVSLRRARAAAILSGGKPDESHVGSTGCTPPNAAASKADMETTVRYLANLLEHAAAKSPKGSRADATPLGRSAALREGEKIVGERLAAAVAAVASQQVDEVLPPVASKIRLVEERVDSFEQKSMQESQNVQKVENKISGFERSHSKVMETLRANTESLRAEFTRMSRQLRVDVEEKVSSQSAVAGSDLEQLSRTIDKRLHAEREARLELQQTTRQTLQQTKRSVEDCESRLNNLRDQFVHMDNLCAQLQSWQSRHEGTAVVDPPNSKRMFGGASPRKGGYGLARDEEVEDAVRTAVRKQLSVVQGGFDHKLQELQAATRDKLSSMQEEIQHRQEAVLGLVEGVLDSALQPGAGGVLGFSRERGGESAGNESAPERKQVTEELTALKDRVATVEGGLSDRVTTLHEYVNSVRVDSEKWKSRLGELEASVKRVCATSADSESREEAQVAAEKKMDRLDRRVESLLAEVESAGESVRRHDGDIAMLKQRLASDTTVAATVEAHSKLITSVESRIGLCHEIAERAANSCTALQDACARSTRASERATSDLKELTARVSDGDHVHKNMLSRVEKLEKITSDGSLVPREELESCAGGLVRGIETKLSTRVTVLETTSAAMQELLDGIKTENETDEAIAAASAAAPVLTRLSRVERGVGQLQHSLERCEEQGADLRRGLESVVATAAANARSLRQVESSAARDREDAIGELRSELTTTLASSREALNTTRRTVSDLSGRIAMLEGSVQGIRREYRPSSEAVSAAQSEASSALAAVEELRQLVDKRGSVLDDRVAKAAQTVEAQGAMLGMVENALDEMRRAVEECRARAEAAVRESERAVMMSDEARVTSVECSVDEHSRGIEQLRGNSHLSLDLPMGSSPANALGVGGFGLGMGGEWGADLAGRNSHRCRCLACLDDALAACEEKIRDLKDTLLVPSAAPLDGLGAPSQKPSIVAPGSPILESANAQAITPTRSHQVSSPPASQTLSPSSDPPKAHVSSPTHLSSSTNAHVSMRRTPSPDRNSGIVSKVPLPPLVVASEGGGMQATATSPSRSRGLAPRTVTVDAPKASHRSLTSIASKDCSPARASSPHTLPHTPPNQRGGEDESVSPSLHSYSGVDLIHGPDASPLKRGAGGDAPLHSGMLSPPGDFISDAPHHNFSSAASKARDARRETEEPVSPDGYGFGGGGEDDTQAARQDDGDSGSAGDGADDTEGFNMGIAALHAQEEYLQMFATDSSRSHTGRGSPSGVAAGMSGRSAEGSGIADLYFRDFGSTAAEALEVVGLTQDAAQRAALGLLAVTPSLTVGREADGGARSAAAVAPGTHMAGGTPGDLSPLSPRRLTKKSTTPARSQPVLRRHRANASAPPTSATAAGSMPQIMNRDGSLSPRRSPTTPRTRIQGADPDTSPAGPQRVSNRLASGVRASSPSKSPRSVPSQSFTPTSMSPRETSSASGASPTAPSSPTDPTHTSTGAGAAAAAASGTAGASAQPSPNSHHELFLLLKGEQGLRCQFRVSTHLDGHLEHTLSHVAAGGPSEAGGLMVGDKLLSIWDAPVHNVPTKELAEKLKSVATCVVVRVQRRRVNFPVVVDEVLRSASSRIATVHVLLRFSAHDIIASGRMSRAARYGFTLQPTGTGELLVREVAPNSVAERCGLRFGDKLVRINAPNTSRCHRHRLPDVFAESHNHNLVGRALEAYLNQDMPGAEAVGQVEAAKESEKDPLRVVTGILLTVQRARVPLERLNPPLAQLDIPSSPTMSPISPKSPSSPKMVAKNLKKKFIGATHAIRLTKSKPMGAVPMPATSTATNPTTASPNTNTLQPSGSSHHIRQPSGHDL